MPGGEAVRGGEAKDEPHPPSASSAVHELSFAELLAGALAAYRDG
jgi:hypothetical protein